mmetsp:Transcript_17723/g.29144  ORF Transcript_17723/g.29144 Transcript_17723/m.29144 type:complete len:267 (+) Transcript_17723:292-1092(+)
MRIEKEFQVYVKPTEHPTLTEFCIKLTGIQQEWVDSGCSLKTALSLFHDWLVSCNLISSDQKETPKWAFITWGDWDLMTMLHSQLKWLKIPKPDYYNSWIDLRKMYSEFYNRRPNGLAGTVEALGIQWTGRQHSGLDDSRNTAMCALKMLRDGCRFKITTSFSTSVNPAGSKRPLNSSDSNANKSSKKPFQQSSSQEESEQRSSLSESSHASDTTRKKALPGKCYCGVPFKARTVRKPGANHGKDFFSCGNFSMLAGAKCSFFLWA